MKKDTFYTAQYLEQRISGLESAINSMDKTTVNVHEKVKSALLSVMPDELAEIEKTILNKLKEKQKKLNKEFEALK
jgi:hypothetical protein